MRLVSARCACERFEMITLLKQTDLRISHDPLPFAINNRADVEAFWAKAIADNPRLWNGPHYLFSGVEALNGCLHATAHLVDFATFIYWRENGRKDAIHITGMSLPVLRDGSLLAIKMSAHTANAGRIYFPAGSFDPVDVAGDVLDLRHNIRREVSEETGFDYPFEAGEEFIVAQNSQHSWHLAIRVPLGLTFADAKTSIMTHLETGSEDEIDDVVQVTDATDFDTLAWFATDLAAWHFANPPKWK